MVVPFGIAAMAMAWVALRDEELDPRARLDWVGFVSLSLAIGAGQLMISRGQRLDWFESPEIVLELGIAINRFVRISRAQPYREQSIV